MILFRGSFRRHRLAHDRGSFDKQTALTPGGLAWRRPLAQDAGLDEPEDADVGRPHDHAHGHAHDHDPPSRRSRWKHDGVRVITGDKLDPIPRRPRDVPPGGDQPRRSGAEDLGRHRGDRARCQDRRAPSRRARERDLRGARPCPDALGRAARIRRRGGPGDFIYVPPFVPHQEINASPTRCWNASWCAPTTRRWWSTSPTSSPSSGRKPSTGSTRSTSIRDAPGVAGAGQRGRVIRVPCRRFRGRISVRGAMSQVSPDLAVSALRRPPIGGTAAGHRAGRTVAPAHQVSGRLAAWGFPAFA